MTADAGRDLAANQVTVGGDVVTIQEFSGFKSLLVLDLLGQLSDDAPELWSADAEFIRKYEAMHTTRLPRTEARRQFRPRVLQQTKAATKEDGELVCDNKGDPLIVVVPTLDEQGDAVIGPDPLGHLTEADWAGSDQALTVSEGPGGEERALAGLKAGLRVARKSVLRILACILATNEDLETWEREQGGPEITDRLDAAGVELLFGTKGQQLLKIAIVASDVIHEQFRPTVDEAGDAVGKLKTFIGRPPSAEPATSPPAMELEAAPAAESESGETPGTAAKPASSSALPERSEDGAAERSSTEPAGVSSSPSGIG